MSESGRSKRILIVEDDEAIAAGLALNFKIAGYAPTVVHDGEQALERIGAEPPDLILLDINLPRKDGIAVLAELRRRGDITPVIIVSARGDEFDKVAALRLGADDYVIKPFSLAELMARVDAVLRRSNHGFAPPPVIPASQPSQALVAFGDVSIDFDTRTVSRGGEEIKLTRLEFELLRFLAQNPSQVFAREDLLRRVWGQTSGSLRTVDNFVGQLRNKLEGDPENPCHFITVRGSGYRFDP